MTGPEINLNTGSAPLTANPNSTSSTTVVMMGLGVKITPRSSGRILVIVTGMAGNGTIGSGCNSQVRYGTGTAPANGAALTGSTSGQEKAFVASTAAGQQGFSLSTIITGLIVGTEYWIDVGLKAVTSGTASIAGIDVVSLEV